jgi:hypothetical protein
MDFVERHLSINEGFDPAPHPEDPHALDAVIATAVITAAVVPFVQGLVAKAAEDSYQAVRALLRRRFAAARGGREPDGATRAVIIVKSGDMVLYLRPEMDDDAIRGLAELPRMLPSGEGRGRIQIFWNEAAGRWQIDEQ